MLINNNLILKPISDYRINLYDGQNMESLIEWNLEEIQEKLRPITCMCLWKLSLYIMITILLYMGYG